ncbi:40S ribosomal protein S4-like isoform X2 [Juglans microcarpa x Juglans regia]|uniref:40S ribosomal protein S4-like isoform X2 n=1 Tax=Juglans microcarpa x Juglans regia TaxID=2249226 RepID=UPI001B7E09B2|nr:40S ribosomal protein S4-like isoform X2 [Juglans microcarpa x Juglans regia]
MGKKWLDSQCGIEGYHCFISTLVVQYLFAFRIIFSDVIIFLTCCLSPTDVVSIPKTNENFRLLYDTKGRFRLHSIRDDEAKFKLCKVRSVQFGQKGIPYLNTYDGRTIRYPDPLIKANDTIKLDLESNKIADFIKFDVGNVVMVTGGRNRGRVGVIKSREKQKGSFETIHVQDATGHEFATRLSNVYTIGKGTKPWVSLPKGKGIKLSIIEEARKRLAAQGATTA